MLTVKTYLAPSSIHGIGLFAAENIPADSLVWQFNEHIDRIYSEDIFLEVCRDTNACTLPHLLNCSYKRGGRYFYLTDNARFMNHSETNDNVAHVLSKDKMEAVRQISRGEELLCNYLSYSDPDDFHIRSIRDKILK